MSILLPAFYFPPISWFASFLKSENDILIEQFEHFPKQTYRNRTNIFAANGKLSLIIPIRHFGKTNMKDVEISYAEDWQKQHWKSIESAYKASPYFEFYEDKLSKLYQHQPKTLVEFNLNCLHIVQDVLKTNVHIALTEHYIQNFEGEDLRNHFSAKKDTELDFKTYFQVFSEKHGFVKDLSVLDLICNLGPESRSYINNL